MGNAANASSITISHLGDSSSATILCDTFNRSDVLILFRLMYLNLVTDEVTITESEF